MTSDGKTHSSGTICKSGVSQNPLRNTTPPIINQGGRGGGDLPTVTKWLFLQPPSLVLFLLHTQTFTAHFLHSLAKLMREFGGMAPLGMVWEGVIVLWSCSFILCHLVYPSVGEVDTDVCG